MKLSELFQVEATPPPSSHGAPRITPLLASLPDDTDDADAHQAEFSDDGDYIADRIIEAMEQQVAGLRVQVARQPFAGEARDQRLHAHLGELQVDDVLNIGTHELLRSNWGGGSYVVRLTRPRRKHSRELGSPTIARAVVSVAGEPLAPKRHRRDDDDDAPRRDLNTDLIAIVLQQLADDKREAAKQSHENQRLIFELLQSNTGKSKLHEVAETVGLVREIRDALGGDAPDPAAAPWNAIGEVAKQLPFLTQAQSGAPHDPHQNPHVAAPSRPAVHPGDGDGSASPSPPPSAPNGNGHGNPADAFGQMPPAVASALSTLSAAHYAGTPAEEAAALAYRVLQLAPNADYWLDQLFAGGGAQDAVQRLTDMGLPLPQDEQGHAWWVAAFEALASPAHAS